ncbi:MAG: cyclic nucleotide-binding domain-containing protein [Anaerolineae bacterium]
MVAVELFRQVEIFRDLTDEHLAQVVGICEERTYSPGTLIFEEDSEGDELYIIESGLVEIKVNPELLGVKPSSSPGPTTVAVLRPGQIFGEIALVDEGRRSAAAVCGEEEDTTLLVLDRDEFIALCEKDPSLGYRVMRNIAADLANKIRSTDMMVREQLLWKRSLEYPLQSRMARGPGQDAS